MDQVRRIEDFNRCPHCGNSEQYYRKERYTVKWNYKGRFDGDLDATDNSGMYDHAETTWQSAMYYCEACNKPICRARPVEPNIRSIIKSIDKLHE